MRVDSVSGHAGGSPAWMKLEFGAERQRSYGATEACDSQVPVYTRVVRVWHQMKCGIHFRPNY